MFKQCYIEQHGSHLLSGNAGADLILFMCSLAVKKTPDKITEAEEIESARSTKNCTQTLESLETD